MYTAPQYSSNWNRTRGLCSIFKKTQTSPPSLTDWHWEDVRNTKYNFFKGSPLPKQMIFTMSTFSGKSTMCKKSPILGKGRIPKVGFGLKIIIREFWEMNLRILLNDFLEPHPKRILPVCSVGCLLPVSPWVDCKAAAAWSLTRLTQLDSADARAARPVGSSACANRLLLPAPFWRRRLPILLLMLLLVRAELRHKVANARCSL